MVAKLRGHATPQKTFSYLSSKLPDTAITTLGRTHLNVSRLGFGGYRIDDRIEDHETALRQALESGVNLIDTSANYGNGGSERLVGKVLRESGIDRESVVVVTKAGYIQGQNYDIALERENKGAPYGEVVKYDQGIWHCIHPEFLQDQISLSLERLGLKTLDVFLLHNPEYYFMHLNKIDSQHDIQKAQYTFYDRIRKAFAFLEGQVNQGLIKHYGVSSNNFTLPTGHPEATAIDVMHNVASEVARDMLGDAESHHFSVVQFPMNLYERGALTEKNNEELTPLEFCKDHNLGVLLNRPLNAVTQAGMKRLALKSQTKGDSDVSSKHEALREMELRFVADFKDHVSDIIDRHGAPFKLAEHLKIDELQNVASENWLHFTSNGLIPEILSVCKGMDDVFQKSAVVNNWQVWKSQYFEVLQSFIEDVLNHAVANENKALQQFEKKCDDSFKYPKAATSMDQKAVLPLISLQDSVCALVGMRKVEYVASLSGLLKESSPMVATETKQALANFEV